MPVPALSHHATQTTTIMHDMPVADWLGRYLPRALSVTGGRKTPWVALT